MAASFVRLWSWLNPVKPGAAGTMIRRRSALNGHKVDRGEFPSSVDFEIELETIALVDSLQSRAFDRTDVDESVLFAVVARERWKWKLPAVLVMAAGCLVVDLGFWSASLLKIPSGGWFPLLIAGAVFTVMTTWNSGRGLLASRLAELSMSLEELFERMREPSVVRVEGTAAYLGRHDAGVPPALLHNLRYNRVVHSRIVLLAMRTDSRARVPDEERVDVEQVAPDFYRVVARHGFAEDPAVPAVLDRLRSTGLVIDPEEATFFLGRETLLATHRPGMALWRERLFARLSRNARRATRYFKIPSHRVCELGAEIEL
jgi:KUP system potassium uptake protein